MSHRARVLVAVLALSALMPVAAGAAGAKWEGWDAGLRRAAGSKRPVVVDVYTDWCGWCKRMDRDVYARDDVQELLSKRFVVVKLDAESDQAVTWSGRKYTERSLAARFRVSGYPTTIFLKPNGDHLVNVPGYVPAERFLLLLRYVGDGHLERGMSFEDFVAKAGAPSNSR